jgi:hypothetical protein
MNVKPVERPTIEDVRELQSRIGRRDRHVIWFDEDGFVIAHTDEERASLAHLEECELHQRLWHSDWMPVTSPGHYLHDPEPGTFTRLPCCL